MKAKCGGLLTNLSFFQIGQSSYIDPFTGYTVFTEEFLRKRKTCCGSGCRHVSPLFTWNNNSYYLLLLVIVIIINMVVLQHYYFY